MITICAWCKATIKPDDGADTVLRVSHGICAACAAKLEAESIATGRRLNGTVRVYVGKPACQRSGGI